LQGYYTTSPAEAFLRALCLYLAERGTSLLSLTGITGQKTVKIHMRGLWRRHEAEETGYLYLEDAVKMMTKEDIERLRRLGIVRIGKEEIEVDVEKLVEKLEEIGSYCNRDLKNLAALYRRRRG